jgi:hypothetical protein
MSIRSVGIKSAATHALRQSVSLVHCTALCRLLVLHTWLLSVLQDGDTISVDAETRVMDIVGVTLEEMAARRAAWQAPPLKATSGTLYKYIKTVISASEGCITDS